MHKEFNKTNSYWITHTEQEIGDIVRIRVFCVDKTCFSGSGHICKIIHYTLLICVYIIYVVAGLYHTKFVEYMKRRINKCLTEEIFNKFPIKSFWQVAKPLTNSCLFAFFILHTISSFALQCITCIYALHW